jgi:hypothetical protein
MRNATNNANYLGIQKLNERERKKIRGKGAYKIHAKKILF